VIAPDSTLYVHGLRFLEYVGSILGILGGFLVTSLQPRTRWWAFILWLISDVLWVTYAILTHQYGLMGQYLIFGGTSFLGWYRLHQYFRVVFTPPSKGQ
jgi:hypothetical protein